MPTYLHPGVYVEEIPSGAKPIEAVSTSTAAFLGYVTKGPMKEPTLIFKWDDYEKMYGGLREIEASADSNQLGDSMGFSVRAFFQNGGTKAYIVRLVDESDGAAEKADKSRGYCQGAPSIDGKFIQCTAVNEGTWADGLVVQFTEKDGAPGTYKVEIGWPDEKGELDPEESFDNVSLVAGTAGFVEDVVNEISEYVTIGIEDAIASDPAGYLIGKTTSGDLAGQDVNFTADAFDGEDTRTITLKMDGLAAETTVTLPKSDFTDNLSALAETIQQLVRAAGKPAFTCTCKTEDAEKHLVLSSGSSKATSKVEASETDMAGTLKLLDPDVKVLSGQDVCDDRIKWEETDKQVELVSGANGVAPTVTEYTNTFSEFLKYRYINIICLPGQFWAANGSGNAVISAAIAHAEKMKSRMVIVDPPPGEEFTTEKKVNKMYLPTSTYSALYYPFVKINNPFYDEEMNPGAYPKLKIPPSSYAAGMWARTDSRRGVWKAPAGVETSLLGVAGMEYTVEDAEQDQLNHLGFNCLRRMPGFGSVIWGSRTLSTKANPEWRYVPVRRTAIFIEQSIYGGIQWAVFEPNNHQLWSSLRANIGSFMDGLFRSGAFQGEKASDAYFVRCGLGDTMEQGDIDRGQVIIIVGFAPLKPAEFVIVRIQQKVAQQ